MNICNADGLGLQFFFDIVRAKIGYIRRDDIYLNKGGLFLVWRSQLYTAMTAFKNLWGNIFWIRKRSRNKTIHPVREL